MRNCQHSNIFHPPLKQIPDNHLNHLHSAPIDNIIIISVINFGAHLCDTFLILLWYFVDTFVILLWYYCDILTIILSSSSSSSSSSKWSNLEPTFVIWCGRGGRWLLDKLPSLELITSLQSDQDYHVVLMIIMRQFCLFLLVQSHRILCCWHFSKSYIKSISFAAGFSNRLVKGKNRKETDADIYLFFGREILGLSQKFRKSWGYHSFKDFLEFLLTNTFFCLVQYGAKVEIVANTKYFIGQRMVTTLAMAQPTQGLNALTNFNKVRPGVHISHPLLTICNLPKISFPSFQLLWQLLTAFGGVYQLSKVWKESNASSRLLKLPNSLCQVLGSHNLSLLDISTSLCYISLALGCWNKMIV